MTGQIRGCPRMGMKAKWVTKGDERALESDGNVGFWLCWYGYNYQIDQMVHFNHVQFIICLYVNNFKKYIFEIKEIWNCAQASWFRIKILQSHQANPSPCLTLYTYPAADIGSWWFACNACPLGVRLIPEKSFRKLDHLHTVKLP